MKITSTDGQYVYYLRERADGAMEGFRLGGSRMYGVFCLSPVRCADDLGRMWLSPWFYSLPLELVSMAGDAFVLLVQLGQDHIELLGLLTGERNLDGFWAFQNVAQSRASHYSAY